MGRIGIMAALHDEISSLLEAMGPDAERTRVGRRDYYTGAIHGREVVVVLARVGKVAAAATAVTLIREFDARVVVFAGLAGAVARDVAVGDVVVATALLQHDLDASPLFPCYEVPLLERSRFDADRATSERLSLAAREYLAEVLPRQVPADTLAAFGVADPRVHRGVIISGDRFVGCGAAVRGLRDELPDALCVEMEGAAVAQICYEYDVPCAVVRTISDRADDEASASFSGFLSRVARYYSAGILERFLTMAW
ncbi:5'-methylthioadenosine/adenosylhomocysteine nucleosidase [Parapusillimonas granuli]|uniref:adenosylhomocysteine nucleosidase n=2 Tax=Parapusillimonas granuli TaxID=380911 RepID=A0A853FWT0_9BURK|nr:5'-methylthioadenosine/adenosylhomocysteine nucleosidase [Parapusillimonas granuli]